MTIITFIIVETINHVIYDDYHLTIDEALYKSLPRIKTIPKTSKINVYLKDERKLIDVDKKISDYVQIDNENENNNFSKQYVEIIIEINNFVTHKLCDRELNEPIINYLINNNIQRACWSMLVKDKLVNVNVKNTFNNYDTSSFIGYKNHLECNINDCDLITYECESKKLYFQNNKKNIVIDSRFGSYEFKFIILQKNYKYDKLLSMPIICNKNTILEKFLKGFNANYIQNIRTIDLELYWAIKKYEKSLDDIYLSYGRSHDNKIIYQNVIKVKIDDDFVLDYYCKNDEIFVDSKFEYLKKYVIMCRPITSQQLYDMLPPILAFISDIIYIYANFENKIPTISDVFENGFFI